MVEVKSNITNLAFEEIVQRVATEIREMMIQSNAEEKVWHKFETLLRISGDGLEIAHLMLREAESNERAQADKSVATLDKPAH